MTQFSCYLYTQGLHKLRKRLGRMPLFFVNYFIQLDCLVHSLIISSGKVEMFLFAACHAFTPHVNAWKR